MSNREPSVAIKLFGTETPDTRGRQLTAGPLSVELDNGAVRYIRYQGVEVLRGIGFLVRDENWGTYPATIDKLNVSDTETGFEVSYDAYCGDASRRIGYQARITADRSGELLFDVIATPDTDFPTNRTGFVVLHPVGCSGRPVAVQHVDGRREQARFPEIIDPLQPFLEIRSLTHEVMPGITATCEMTGDTFEMEDHRNWTDASYKTYCRPLALPWPYTLKRGEAVHQTVRLVMAGVTRPGSEPATGLGQRIELGAVSEQRLPEIGLGVPASEVRHALAEADVLKRLALHLLVCQFDPRQGHDEKVLRDYQALGEHLDAARVLEIVLPCNDEPANELRAIASQVAASGIDLAAITVSPAVDMKAVLPGSAPPRVPPLESIYQAARQAFPDTPLGGGTYAFFTELNRKRPPLDALDFVSFTTGPITHAADDRSVMETLSALPYVSQSVKMFIGDRPFRVGPSGIGARDNPYGDSVTSNPDNLRLCLAEMDPRQRGIFGAAWTLGYLAAFARGGAAAVSMNAPTGPRGLIYRRADYEQPYFDEPGSGSVYPVFHVLRDLARAAGQSLVAVTGTDPAGLATLACRDDDGRITVWLANLRDHAFEVTVSGRDMAGSSLRRLDQDTFIAATQDPAGIPLSKDVVTGDGRCNVGPYGILRIDIPAIG